MAREVRHFIADILEAIAIVNEAIDGKSLEEYQEDSILRFAVERAIEIISEASAEFRMICWRRARKSNGRGSAALGMF